MHIYGLEQSKKKVTKNTDSVANFTSQQEVRGIILVPDEENVSGRQGQSPVLKASFENYLKTGTENDETVTA